MIPGWVAILLSFVQYGITVLSITEIWKIWKLIRTKGMWWLPVVLIATNVFAAIFSFVFGTLTIIGVLTR